MAKVVAALAAARLEAVIVGATAAVLHGVPIVTQDVDLLVRRTRRNEEKIGVLRDALGGLGRVKVTDDVDTLVGGGVSVDVIFDALPGPLPFQGVRARSIRMVVGGKAARVAALEDVIRSKRAANRPKDRAQLPVLEDTLRLKRALARVARR